MTKIVHTWESRDWRDQMLESFEGLRGLSKVAARSALPRCSGKLLMPNVPRERLLYRRCNSIEVQFIAYQQRPHGAPYTSVAKSPLNRVWAGNVARGKIGKPRHVLTSRKIANRVIREAAFAHIAWVVLRNRVEAPIPKDLDRFRINLLSKIHFD